MFEYYPKVVYALDSNDYVVATDITIRSKINNYLETAGFFGPRRYQISNGEAPEIVSYNLYGTPKYSYMLLLANNIQNLYDEWPRTEYSQLEYIEKKYGSLAFAKSNIKHYYTSEGHIIDQRSWDQSADPNKYLKTFFDWEQDINFEKSKIRVVRADALQKIEVGIQELLNSAEST